MRPRILVVPMAIAWCLLGAPAFAQAVSYLRVEPRAGGEPRISLVEIDAATGDRADLGDPLDHAAWLYGLGEHASHNYTALMPQDAGTFGASDLLADSQAVLFGLERHERVVEMEAAVFALLAERAGFEWAPGGDAAGDADDNGDDGGEPDAVRVRRIEASKAIVRATRQPEGVQHSTIVTAKRGERAEIRALFDPTMLQPESILPVRVYTEGDGAKGATVIATHVETGAEQRVVADDKAIAILTLDRAGAWRVEFHTVTEAPPGDAEADWVVYSATLSFEVIGGGR
jgi:hypothetical protein